MGSNFSSSTPDPYDRRRRVDVACEIVKYEPNDNLGASASIFNLPEIITTQKPEAYEPQGIGLGPNYHNRFCSNRKLEQMKLSAVRLVLQNKGIKNLKLVIDEVRKIIPNARSCYKEVQMIDDINLALIFTVDGIYLLYLLYSYGLATDSEKEMLQVPLINKDPYQDTVFKRGVDSRRRLSVKDIMMEENQIPFTVLVEVDKALHLTSGTSTSTSGIDILSSMFRSFCEIHSPLELCSTTQATFRIDHLLQYMYQSIMWNRNMDEKINEVKKVEKTDEKKDEEKVEKIEEKKDDKKFAKVYEKKDEVKNDDGMKKYEKRVEKRDVKKDQVKKVEKADLKKIKVKKIKVNKVNKKVAQVDEKKDEAKKDDKKNEVKKYDREKKGETTCYALFPMSTMPSWMYEYCELLLGNFPRDEIVALYKQTVATLETFSQSKPALPSASKLHDRAGYSFHLLPKDKGIWEIDIKGKDFYLPCVALNNNSEVIFRNLVAYELFAPYTHNFPLGEYMGLMCGLINTLDDVKLLKKKNIIKGELHDDEVVQLFVRMSSSTSSMKTNTKSHLQLNLEKVNKVYESRPRVKMILLLKKVAYWVLLALTAFGRFVEVSWKIAVFVASVVAGFVLIRQAYCDVNGCNDSNISLMPT